MRRRLGAIAWAAAFGSLLWAVDALRPMFRVMGD